MLVPSVDIQNGECVQLVGGETCVIRAGNPDVWVNRFSRVGEVAVIDLDAARGRGNNTELIKQLCRKYPVRVGGGIRDTKTAVDWLDAGACKVIIGTAASPGFLKDLPGERIIVALDARNGDVQINGWTAGTGKSVFEQVALLSPFASEFLVTTIEREGQMSGLDENLISQLSDEFPNVRFTVAGGASAPDEIAKADLGGIDVQVGMALYTNVFDEADVLISMLEVSAGAGPWPTVVVDQCGVVLGLVYSSRESLKLALKDSRGIYWSRQRGLWKKGDTSGNSQTLVRVAINCNRDSLKFTVRQQGTGFCHKGDWTCFGSAAENAGAEGFQKALRKIEASYFRGAPGSWTKYLAQNPALMDSKITEEAGELIAADVNSSEEVLHEFCDLLYFSYLRLLRSGQSWPDVERLLHSRSLKYSRRFNQSSVQDPT